MSAMTCSLPGIEGGPHTVPTSHRSTEELTAELAAVRSRLAEAKATDALIEKLAELVAEQAELDRRKVAVGDEIQRVVQAVYRRYEGRRAPVNRMAEALGVTPNRIYQIRDEPRKA